MPTTETRTFVGQSATAVGDGYAGFRMNRTYELEVEYQPDGAVHVTLNHHEHVSPGAGPMVLTAEQWATWFRKP